MSKRKIVNWIVSLVLIGLAIYYFYPENALPADTVIDSIVIHKSKKEMLVYSNGELQKTYKISIGRNPIGHKEYQGDKKTPEGLYYINDRNPHSGFHKNLGVSYPNKADLEHAKQLGKPAGGDIKIHGLKNGLGFIGKFHRWFNWTFGCIAVTDREVDELYNAVKIGSPIEIKP